jgi:DNA-binding beta-propeller fold protein YncE
MRRLVTIALLLAVIAPSKAQADFSLVQVSSGRLDYIHTAIAIPPNGNVYAADYDWQRVDYFNPQ